MISKFDDFLLESKEKKTYLQQVINVLSKSKFPLTVDEICDEINSFGEIKIPKTSYRSVSTIVLSYTKGKEDTSSAKSRNKSGKVFFEIVNERPQTFKLIDNISQIELDDDLTVESSMTFVEAAQYILKKNDNRPMTSYEVWDQSQDFTPKTGKTPWDTMNAQMILYSENSTAKNKKKNSLFRIIEGTRPYKFQLINPEKEVEPTNDELEKYYLLGAYDKNIPDWWKQCVEEGKWYNGFALDGEETLKDKVNEIPVGANVAIKSTYLRERVKPAMMIKARGIVTKNYEDGTQLDVDWETDFTPFEIVRNDVGGYRSTLHEVNNQEHIDLIWNSDKKGEDVPKEREIMSPYDFFSSSTGGRSTYSIKDDPTVVATKPDKYQMSIPINKKVETEETTQITDEKPKVFGDYSSNPFDQAICVLGESGAGKSTSINNILLSKNHIYQYIIPSASTTGLLSQFSPRENGYIQSRLGKMIEDAWQNPNILYTAVFDECHKTNTIEMINDELLQAISKDRNFGNRFISLDEDTAKLFKNSQKDDSGNIKIPNNFGFIFISSKPEIFQNNPDFFNRVDLLEITESKRPKTIEELNILRKKSKSEKIALLETLEAKQNQ